MHGILIHQVVLDSKETGIVEVRLASGSILLQRLDDLGFTLIESLFTGLTDIKIDEPVGNSDVKQVTEEDPNKIFTAVEQEPTPAGGMAAFYKYLGNNIRYPAVAKENNVQGKVFMQFVVERDGSLTDVKVIRGIGSGCDEEAIRVLKNAPRWKAGIQNGRPVRVQYNVPISFTLQQEDQ